MAHPVGTCRVGEDDHAVVNTNLKVHGVKNLYLISTALIPTAGIANPTFSLFCLCEYLAECFNKKSKTLLL